MTGVAVSQQNRRRGTVGAAQVISEAPLAAQVEQLLQELLDGTPLADDPVTSITFDVSGILTPDFRTPVTVVRIAPRPPIDAGHEMTHAPGTEFTVAAVHASGGHIITGEPLVPLDTEELERFARAAPRDASYIVTAVGSLVNAAHELEAGRILLEYAEPRSLEYAHHFSNGAIAVRERTALFNHSLLGDAATIGTTLSLVAEHIIPRARLYVTTNDGGSTPITRLPVAPVHSMHAGRPTELIGAAALCGIDDGRLIVAGSDDHFFGEIISGVPAVIPTYRDTTGLRIATQTANLLPITPSVMGSRLGPPLLITHGEGSSPDQSLSVHRHSTVDLRALGAACAPHSDWANRVVAINNAAEMDQALASAQARVNARLVSFGTPPSQVRTLESRVIATAYQHPRVVSVRVRGVAGESTGTILAGGAQHAAR